MNPARFTIAGRPIGAGHPAYIIAEMSANHGHDINQAKAIIRAAKAAGADAIKLQTYTPDTMTIDADTPWFKIGEGTLWAGRTLYDLYREASTPWEWHAELKTCAEALGLQLFSTPFDATAVEFLEGLNVPAHKIASFEVTDLPLIRRVARTGKPVIMSTGMASLAEIDDAVTAFREAGGGQLALLKCTSAYPAPEGEINLATLRHLAGAFGVTVGLSDHTLGIAIPAAAVALGAGIIEKHFTLSRELPGPDSKFSLEPDEFRAMVRAVRSTEQAIGTVSYAVTAKEQASRVFRRSLFVVADLAAGDILTEQNVRVIRPGYGLAPKHLPLVLGRKASRAIARGTPLDWALLA